MPTVRELVDRATRTLRQAGIEDPGREAALLLRTLLGMSASALLAHDRDVVEPSVATRFDRSIETRAAGVPAAYLLGVREFFGREFAVDSRVLVPRPETEHLVEAALELPLPESARVLDVGTGSGCIAVTLASERPRWRVTASDRSVAALAVASANAARHGVAERVDFHAADLVSAIDLADFDLVVANLPYVDLLDRDRLGLGHEPAGALFAAAGGRFEIERLRELAVDLPGGAFLLCEIGDGQASALASSTDLRIWKEPMLRRDLAGRERDLIWERVRTKGGVTWTAS